MRLYIDPGTGSILFAVLVGLIGAISWIFKQIIIKIRFLLSGGKYIEKHSKIIPLVIFSEGKRYWSVFKPICDELEKRAFDTTYLTTSQDDPALKTSYKYIHFKYIGEGNKAYAKMNFIKANILLSTTPGLDVYQWKRSKDVDFYVHLLHCAAEVTSYRMFGLDNYDAIFISGEYQYNDERKLEELRNLPKKELIMVGIPYMDEMKKRYEDNPLGPKDKKTVLLAPSWGKSSIFNKYKGSIIEELLKTGYHIIIRPNPQSFISEKELIDELMKKYPSSNRVEWNNDSDNFEVLKRSDILISDFSGIIFDFSLVFDRPVIYADTQFDKSPYDACWIDTPFWTFTALPRIGEKLTKENLKNLSHMIDSCLNDNKYSKGREEVRKETWLYPKEGASRVADYLINKYKEISTINKGAK